MKPIEVQLEQDHLLRQVQRFSPQRALAELIWNALDADASRVEVRFDTNTRGALEVIDAIDVVDDGHGMTLAAVTRGFGHLGGSWKTSEARSQGRKRQLHGRAGLGRYAGFRLGEAVRWTTRARGNEGIEEIVIEGVRATSRTFTPSGAKVVERRKPGTIVRIQQLEPDEARALRQKAARDQLTKEFALYLRANQDAAIFVDGHRLDPAEVQEHVQEYELEGLTLRDGDAIEARLAVVEWSIPIERELFLCDGAGFIVSDVAPGIKAKDFRFTAFLKTPFFRDLQEKGTLDVAQLDPVAQGLIEAAREKLREHFRRRKVEQHRNVIEALKAEGVYPYEKPPATVIEHVERQVFEVLAGGLSEHLPNFDESDAKSKRFTLTMVKNAIEQGPGGLQSILQSVIELAPGKQRELAGLLQKTSLAAIIDASKTVATRLEVLAGLESLVFDAETKGRLRERNQLHRLLVEHTWLFGEEFHLSVDDEGLTAVLRKHKAMIGRSDDEDLAPVTTADGSRGIVDLMLSRAIQSPREGEVEHLVVELKRPSQKINDDVLAQVRKYATAVGLDERFRDTKTRWIFWAVSNDIDEGVRMSLVGRPNVPDGQWAVIPQARAVIWAKTWSEIFTSARARLQFFKEKLDYMATHDSGLDYLRRTHASYVPNATANTTTHTAG